MITIWALIRQHLKGVQTIQKLKYKDARLKIRKKTATKC